MIDPIRRHFFLSHGCDAEELVVPICRRWQFLLRTWDVDTFPFRFEGPRTTLRNNKKMSYYCGHY
jgi:hypothetical protein